MKYDTLENIVMYGVIILLIVIIVAAPIIVLYEVHADNQSKYNVMVTYIMDSHPPTISISVTDTKMFEFLKANGYKITDIDGSIAVFTKQTAEKD